MYLLFFYFNIIKSWKSLREFIFTKKIQFALIAFADFWALKFCSSTCLSFLFDWLSFYPPDSTQNSVFAFAFSYSFIKYKKRFLKTNTISTTYVVGWCRTTHLQFIFCQRNWDEKWWHENALQSYFKSWLNLNFLCYQISILTFEASKLKISYWELLENENCTCWAELQAKVIQFQEKCVHTSFG